MQVRTILSAIVSLCVCTLLIPGTVNGETSFDNAVHGNGFSYISQKHTYEPPVYSPNRSLMSFEDKDRDYTESQLRRFEIIFFISLPVSLFFSFAGAAAFKAAAEGEIQFSSLDYSYILLSSIGISFSIGLHDNRVVYRKGHYQQEQQK
jgi:hypothetical protein